jgi:hypothetical protein
VWATLIDFSHTLLDRGRVKGDLMELHGWSSPQMLAWYGRRAQRGHAVITTSWEADLHDAVAGA